MAEKTYWQPGAEGEDLPAESAQIARALEMQEERQEYFTEVECVEYTQAELAGMTRAAVSRIMDGLADGVC